MSTYIKLIPSPIIEEVSYQIFRYWSDEQLGWLEFKKPLNQFVFIAYSDGDKQIELSKSDILDIYHRIQLMNGCIEEKINFTLS